ncbi:hypothetical protein RCL1_008551 [Eukaryota sp. TZLM3-RCL]
MKNELNQLLLQHFWVESGILFRNLVSGFQSLKDTNSPILIEASNIVLSLSDEIWSGLFPQGVEVPDKSLDNLKYSVRKLQNKFKVLLESETFSKKFSLAKEKDVKLYNVLIENSSLSSTPSSSFLLSIVPKKYGLNLNDDDFVACVRMRLSLDPGIVLSQSLCLCGKFASFDHIVCCSHFNWCRFILQDNMIKTMDACCKSLKVVSTIKPLLNLLVNIKNTWSSKSRGDLHLQLLDSKELIVDAATVYFKSSGNVNKLSCNADSILKRSEDLKKNKYSSIIACLNQTRQRKLVFLPIAVSLNGRLGSSAEAFFKDFETMIRKGGQSYSSVHLLKVRFVFVLFKKMSTFIRNIGLKLVSTEAGLERVTCFNLEH